MLIPAGKVKGSLRPPRLSLNRHPERLTGWVSKLVSSHQSELRTAGLGAGSENASVNRKSGFDRTVSVPVLVTLPRGLLAVTSYVPALAKVRFCKTSAGPVWPGINSPLNRQE